MSPPADLDGLSAAALKALVVQLLDEVRALKQVVADQRAEIARLKGLKGPPSINPSLKPSGMEQASERKSPTGGSKRRGRGGKQMRRVAIEDQVLTAEVPAGSRFKGYQSFLIQDLVLRPVAIRYRRERWVTPDGRTVVAPLPSGIDGHFGPELRRFVLAQYQSGSGHCAAAGGIARGHRYRGFQTAGRAAVDRTARAFRRRSARRVARRAGDGGLDHGRRHRRPPQGHKRLLYPDRQRPLRL